MPDRGLHFIFRIPVVWDAAARQIYYIFENFLDMVNITDLANPDFANEILDSHGSKLETLTCERYDICLNDKRSNVVM